MGKEGSLCEKDGRRLIPLLLLSRVKNSCDIFGDWRLDMRPRRETVGMLLQTKSGGVKRVSCEAELAAGK